MKRLGLIILGLLVLVGGWYFFVRDHNHRVSFESPHAPGTIYSTLKNWNIPIHTDVDSVQLIESTPYNSLSHKVFLKDSVFDYRWDIQRKNDSVTKVIAYVSDNDNFFTQNLQGIYTKNDFVKRNVEAVTHLMNSLYAHESSYKAEVLKDSTFSLKRKYCAYISLESGVFQKGNTMISNIGLIMNYLKSNEIPISGDPFLQVTDWDKDTETIKFDFCFPIAPMNRMPAPYPGIKFKYTSDIKGLKAIFNGNYKLTDRAWYKMMDYADSRGIELEGFPVEIYRNDPHSGGNELEWVAEIYWAQK